MSRAAELDDPYRGSSRHYDRLIEPLLAALRQIGLRPGLGPARAGMQVLDIGCGTGSHLELYRRAGCRVAGIDRSPAMLAEARRKLGAGALLTLGDGTRLPFGAATIDLIVVMMALHEMPPEVRQQVLAECRRVLKPSGARLLAIDYARIDRRRFPRGYFYGALRWVVERLAGGDHYRNFRDFIARGALLPLLQQHGFELLEHKIVSGGNIALAAVAPVR